MEIIGDIDDSPGGIPRFEKRTEDVESTDKASGS